MKRLLNSFLDILSRSAISRHHLYSNGIYVKSVSLGIDKWLILSKESVFFWIANSSSLIIAKSLCIVYYFCVNTKNKSLLFLNFSFLKTFDKFISIYYDIKNFDKTETWHQADSHKYSQKTSKHLASHQTSSFLIHSFAIYILFFYLCNIINDKMFLPIHKEELITSTASINNSPLSFSNFIRLN